MHGDYLHVDAATIFLVTDPARFDVIVTDNLFGDIVTDLAAAITGGIGLAASGNINPDRTAPSMFEPVHGSAPDIAGTGTADPTATDPLGRDAARAPRSRQARRQVEQAVAADLLERGRAEYRARRRPSATRSPRASRAEPRQQREPPSQRPGGPAPGRW